jgi:nitrogen regulatory protein PII
LIPVAAFRDNRISNEFIGENKMNQSKINNSKRILKQIKAFLHHVRSAAVVEALSDAGYKNITLIDVKGTLRALNESEQNYSTEAGVIISEVRISLVCEDNQVDEITTIIRKAGRIGANISGWVYVSPIDQALPIDGGNI